MRRLQWIWIVIASAVLASGSAAGPAATSERYAYSTYREVSGRVTLLADGYLAAFHGEDPYVPITVAVGLANPGRAVVVTPESFTLLDASGKEYPAASFEEIARRHPKRQFDGALLRSHPIVVGNQFSTSMMLDGNFYPAPAGERLRVDRVELGPFTWFFSLLYFPRPESGLDGVLTLRIAGGGIKAPVKVRFQVPRVLAGQAS
jgi:hypothetical protein